jgi:dTDP-4-amino-4,6-dideoxygalactose transaminase
MWWGESFDSIQAAVLNAKLPLLDQYNAARQNAARKYTMAFEGTTNILWRPVFAIFVTVMFFINIHYEL